MNTATSWGQAFANSLFTLWERIVDALPTLLGALIILLIGLWISGALSRLVGKVIRMTKVDRAVTKIDIVAKMEEMGWHVKPSYIIAWFVKWFFIIVTLITVADLLKWTQVTSFLDAVITYIPNVIIAVVILVVGSLAAQFVHGIVAQAMAHSQISEMKHYVPLVAKWSIIVFSVIAALTHLRIAEQLLQTLFTGIIVAISLGLGLAFGLGGKDRAKEFLEKVGR